MKRKTPLRAKKPMKRTRWSHKPKQGRKALIAQADGLIQEAVLARDKGKCQKCGAKATEGHHIVHRRYLSTRWHEDNVISVCRRCHKWEGIGKLRGAFIRFCIKWLGGQAAYDELRLYANTGPSEDPEDAVERLQKVLDL